ncbi:hypothetical protein KIK15_08865, partial [Williamsia sp. CHRR-6]|nr:hypothetical protein [Williamsia sp. CHRR-6]
LLFTMYGGCSTPACPAPFTHTEAHHAETDWAAGGLTNSTHLAPACGPHNRAVHNNPGGWQTVKITTGPDRGRYGWTANGTTNPPCTNHLHQPHRILEENAPVDPDWSDIEHRLELVLAEHAARPPDPEPIIIRVIDYRSPIRP